MSATGKKINPNTAETRTHVKLRKYSVLPCTVNILLVYGIITNDPGSVEDSATLTSCNEVEKQGFNSSACYIGRITCLSLDSVLQCRTAISYCIAKGCLALCLRNCNPDKVFSRSLTSLWCNLNSTLTPSRHHGKEAYLN